VLDSKANTRNVIRDKFASKIEAKNSEEAAKAAAAELKVVQLASASGEPGTQSVEDVTISKEGGKVSRNPSKAKLPQGSKDDRGSIGTIETHNKSTLLTSATVFAPDNIDKDFRPVLIKMW
jgi:hypothetical protein